MSAGYYWDESLPDLIPEVDWSALSPVEWRRISDDLDEHVSTARDFMAPTPSAAEIRSWDENRTIKSQREEIARLEAMVQVARSSVATRRGVPISDVEINVRDNTVTYGKVLS